MKNMDLNCVELQKNIYQFQDIAGNCATLVLGSQKALLFDTMMGFTDLKKSIKKITKLPLVVINSHGHFDHTGGNFQFETVYLNREDWPLLQKNNEGLHIIQENIAVDISQCRQSFCMQDKIKNITPGEKVDLGELTAKVVSLPGHTAGSIGILLEERRILLAGDAFTPQMCLFFPESLSIEEYQKTLQYTMNLEYDFFVLGHFMRLFPKHILQKFWECTLVVEKEKSYDFEYSLIPSYTGKVHIFEPYNSEIGEMICLIC